MSELSIPVKRVGRPKLSEDERKQRIRESNKKYYDKISESRGPVGRPPLSEAERKRRLKENNKRYYEKMRAIIKKSKELVS